MKFICASKLLETGEVDLLQSNHRIRKVLCTEGQPDMLNITVVIHLPDMLNITIVIHL